MEVDQRETAKLREIIVNRTTNTEVAVKRNNTIVQIADIDADINANELHEEIKRNCRHVSDEDITMLSMRPTRDGNQAATVSLQKKWPKTS